MKKKKLISWSILNQTHFRRSNRIKSIQLKTIEIFGMMDCYCANF